MNPLESSANEFTNITTLGTTVISGKLVLVRVVVNKKGATSNVATLNRLDSPEGKTAIGVIDTTDKVGNIEYGLPCNNGLEVVTATGTQADLTIVTRPQP